VRYVLPTNHYIANNASFNTKRQQQQQEEEEANVFVTKAKLRVPTFFRTDANRDDAKNSASCCNESAIDYNFIFRS
jgi:hypothetical protein